MQVESGAAKDELKRLRKEMLRLKNEWTTLRALYESAKVHNFPYMLAQQVGRAPVTMQRTCCSVNIVSL